MKRLSGHQTYTGPGMFHIGLLSNQNLQVLRQVLRRQEEEEGTEKRELREEPAVKNAVDLRENPEVKDGVERGVEKGVDKGVMEERITSIIIN